MAILDQPELIGELAEDDPERADLLEVQHDISQLAWLAYRTRTVNALFGSQMTPDQVAAQFSDRAIDILVAYDEYIRKQR